MATPRQHGGAELLHIPLNLPGFKGLNRQATGALLGPEWCNRLENTVLDENNRLAARKGFEVITTSAHTDAFVQLHEFIKLDGTTELCATDDQNAILRSADDGETWSDVTSAATVADPNMQIVTFNDVMMGFQDNNTPVVYDNVTATWSDSAATGVPTGDVALAAFGRIWALDNDGVTIKYCALLDETDWNGADTGSLDMTNVWPSPDVVTAIAAFNARLIVFGRNNIVIWEDGANTALGVDPAALYVVDTVPGVGCIARDSVANVDGDLWFLSAIGVMSLSRTIQEKSNPLANLSINVQDYLKSVYNSMLDTADVRSAYSPEDRFYLLSLPSGSASTESGLVFCFDTRGFIEGGAARCSGVWNNMVPTAMVRRLNGDLVYTRKANEGELGRYSTYLDDEDTYSIEYESSWNSLESSNLKILKRISGLFFTERNVNLTVKWAFDFDLSFTSRIIPLTSRGAASEYGIAEYNIAEYGGGVNIEPGKVAGAGTGKYIKIGISADINSNGLALQELSIYAKHGRLR